MSINLQSNKAVILLVDTQVRKYTDEQLGTFFFGWCLLCRGVFRGVFVAHAENKCADAQIVARATSHFWADSQLFEVDFDRLVPPR